MSETTQSCWSTTKSYLHPNSVFAYSTVKIVQIHDWRVGLLHRLIQLFIFGYVIGYVIIWNENFLAKEATYGTISTKVLGSSLGYNQFGEEKYADAADLIVPSSEPNALFITTKYSTTQEQTVGWCSPPKVKSCQFDQDCFKVNSTNQLKYKCTNNKCTYFQWCPEENEDNQPNNITEIVSLMNVNNFTIWIKSQIRFPVLSKEVFSTIREKIPVFYSKDLKRGNLFTVDEILKLTNLENTTYNEIRNRGAIIKFTVRWRCNLDRVDPNDPRESCFITYNAIRVDNSLINDGYNFRSVSTYKTNGVNYRDLTKYYGIRIFFEVSGEGYRISVIDIILQLSSGLALLVLATLVCDILIQYCFPSKDKYSAAKNLIVKADDENRDVTEENPLLSPKSVYGNFE